MSSKATPDGGQVTSDQGPTAAELLKWMLAVLDGRLSTEGKKAFTLACDLVLERIAALEAKNARLTAERDDVLKLLGVTAMKAREYLNERDAHIAINQGAVPFEQTVFGIAIENIAKIKAELARLREALTLALTVADEALPYLVQWFVDSDPEGAANPYPAGLSADLERAKALSQKGEVDAHRT